MYKRREFDYDGLSFHEYIGMALDGLKLQLLVQQFTGPVHCPHCDTVTTADKIWVTIPERWKYCCDNCKHHELSQPQVLASTLLHSPVPATALFLERAGDTQRAHELAATQHIDLGHYSDDRYAHLQLPMPAGLESETPMFKAAFANDVRCVREICKSTTSNLNALSAAGETALHYAVLASNDAVIAELLRAGADVDACNTRGMTALHTALSHRRERCVRLLLAHGANPNAADCGIIASRSYAWMLGRWTYCDPACRRR